MITLDSYGTLVAGSLVLLLGRKLVASIRPLQTYSIPEPVVGGLVVALALYAAQATGGFEVRFDSALSTPLMLGFFASIGLNADLASLRQGGRPLMKLLAVVVTFLIAQNLAGIALATLLGFNPLIGLLAGSISLSGGHGTGAAWGAVFSERYGLHSATELALFLAIALMSLRLWELAALALPMMVLLVCQTALMAGFAILVTFRVMGSNHDAAVVAAGHCGFGLGATPTAIANMQAVTDRFGPSRLAFLVVPMVGAFFIDIANAIVIKLALAIIG